MPPIPRYLGFFFGALAVIFLFLAFRRSGFSARVNQPAAKTYLRIGVIFAAVSLYLFLNQRF